MKEFFHTLPLAVIHRMTRILIITIVSFASVLYGQQYPKPYYDFTIKVNDTLKCQIVSNDSLLHFDNKQNFAPALIIDLGTINSSETKDYDFYITNHSDSSLYIAQNYWIEPQFSPIYDKSQIKIPQNGTSKFTWRCNALRRTGRFEKQGEIILSQCRIYIKFKGNYSPPGLVIKNSPAVKTGFINERVTSEFYLYNNIKYDDWGKEVDRVDIKINSIKTDKNIKIEYAKNDTLTNTIKSDSFKVFKVSFIPDRIGKSVSKVTLYIMGCKVEYILYVTTKARPKEKKYHR